PPCASGVRGLFCPPVRSLRYSGASDTLTESEPPGFARSRLILSAGSLAALFRRFGHLDGVRTSGLRTVPARGIPRPYGLQARRARGATPQARRCTRRPDLRSTDNRAA